MDLPMAIDQEIEEKFGYELSSELSNLTHVEWEELAVLILTAHHMVKSDIKEDVGDNTEEHD